MREWSSVLAVRGAESALRLSVLPDNHEIRPHRVLMSSDGSTLCAFVYRAGRHGRRPILEMIIEMVVKPRDEDTPTQVYGWSDTQTLGGVHPYEDLAQGESLEEILPY